MLDGLVLLNGMGLNIAGIIWKNANTRQQNI